MLVQCQPAYESERHMSDEMTVGSLLDGRLFLPPGNHRPGDARPSSDRLLRSSDPAGVRRYIFANALGATFPVIAGLLLFGWRALGAICMIELSALVGTYAWKRVGARGGQLRYDQALWLGLVLAMMLPAELFRAAAWPALAAGGIILAGAIWVFGGIGRSGAMAVLATYLLMFVCLGQLLVPQSVLHRQRMFFGDLLNAQAGSTEQAMSQPWYQGWQQITHDAIRQTAASQVLVAYTSGQELTGMQWISLDSLLRDRLPPLEDLVVGGHPAPIGMGSAIAVIIGGLFLLYRGLIDWRVPFILLTAAAAALIVLPVPIVIKENEIIWSWLAMRASDIGWQKGLTLVNYELLAGPLLFSAFFLATSPAIRPLLPGARNLYALVAGLLAAVLQLYLSVLIGAYLGVLLAGLLTPVLDRRWESKTLV